VEHGRRVVVELPGVVFAFSANFLLNKGQKKNRTTTPCVARSQICAWLGGPRQKTGAKNGTKEEKKKEKKEKKGKILPHQQSLTSTLKPIDATRCTCKRPV
jgi:hypothetical protein